MSSHPDSPVDDVIDAVLALLAESLHAGLVYLARVVGESLHIVRALDRAGMGLADGDTIALCDSYCATMLAEALPALVVPDARADPAFAARATTLAMGIGAYSGVPLYRADGVLYGTLCALHPTARTPEARDISLLRFAARAVVRAVDAMALQRALDAEAAARETAEQAAALAEVSAALSSSLDPGEIYALILQQAARVLPFDQAEIVLYRDGWVVSAAGLGESSVSPGTPLVPIDTGTSTWRALVAGRAVHLPDTRAVRDRPDLAPWGRPSRIRSAIVVPLLIDGELLGSFDVSSCTANFYTAAQVRLAAAFGDRATQALRNARLYAAERARRRAAEELAALRSDFVASVSHELRTPLTAMVGFAELLEARWGEMDEPQRRASVRKIVVSAGRQRRLVEDLLLLSRLDAGVLSTRPRITPVLGMVARAMEEVQARYGEQAVDLNGPAEATVLVDPDRAHQVLANLIDNAAKYSPEGSPVAVDWAVGDGRVVLRVRDHGPGIPLENQAALFTRFGRLPGSRARAGHVGTGLGLYISRGLVEAMGGDLALEHSGPAGSTFRLRLPLSAEKLQRPPVSG